MGCRGSGRGFSMTLSPGSSVAPATRPFLMMALPSGRAADTTSTTRRQTSDRLVTGAMLKHGHKSAKYASALTAESRWLYCRLVSDPGDGPPGRIC